MPEDVTKIILETELNGKAFKEAQKELAKLDIELKIWVKAERFRFQK